MKHTKGFTLIELLVVIAIIALLSTLAVVSLNNARTKSRDAKRVSDVKQMQTALELYFADQQAYPTQTVTAGGATSDCLSSAAGFTAVADCTGTVYMGQVPSAPTPPTGNNYVYSGSADNYTIVFELEGQTGQLAPGSRTATPPTGIQ